MTLLSLLLVGFLLGMKHAVESDHLAAVASLATRQISIASTLRQGMAWGVGHTATLMIVGGAALAMDGAIPASMERMLELCVGVMLVGLGIDVIGRVIRQRIHFHVHRHGSGEVHIHAHSHAQDAAAPPPAMRLPVIGAERLDELPVVKLDFHHSSTPHEHEHARRLPLRALAVGMMHGLAGSAALILLSLQTVHSVPLGIIYVLTFGVGSITGMALLSVVIAIPLHLSRRYSGKYLTSLHRSAAAVIGAVTVCLGVLIVYRIAFVEGLLRG